MEARDELSIEQLMNHVYSELKCTSCPRKVCANTYNMQLFARMAFEEKWRVINGKVKCQDCVK